MTDAVFGACLGGAWMLANLWCLRRLLAAWLDPSRSRRRALWWLLLKVPVLYAALFVLLTHSRVSPGWFGIGLTAVLTVVLGRWALRMPAWPAGASHGR